MASGSFWCSKWSAIGSILCFKQALVPGMLYSVDLRTQARGPGDPGTRTRIGIHCMCT